MSTPYRTLKNTRILEDTTRFPTTFGNEFPRRAGCRTRRRSSRPGIEQLEGRALLSVITFTDRGAWRTALGGAPTRLIDFNGFPMNTPASTQYASSGIIFDSGVIDQTGAAPNSLNAAFNGQTIMWHFTVPVFAVGWDRTNTADIHDYEVFDQSGQLLSRLELHPAPTSGGPIFGGFISDVPIGKATSFSPNDDQRHSIDNIEFAVSTQPDLAVTQVGLNRAGLYALYRVDGAPLPAATTAEFWWASGDSPSQKLALAAAPVDIPAGTSVGPHDDVGVLAANENLPPPQGTTHLLVIFDPNNAIDESNENNNFAAIPVHFGPKVEVNARHSDGTLVTDASPLIMNELYTVEAKIINYDSLPHSYHVHWTGFVAPPVGGFTPALALPQDFDTGQVPPDSSVTWTSDQFHY